MRTLVPLKIDVGIDSDTGHAKYPNFNLISSTVRKGMDWAKYIDIHGGGMHYDKTCGHKEDSVDSPYGHQCCCICVPQDFATEALALFPDVVTQITATEWESFYNDKAHAHEDDEIVDTDVLNGLSAQRNLMVARGKDITALDTKIDKALDANDKTERGVRANPDKTWANAGTRQGITIK